MRQLLVSTTLTAVLAVAALAAQDQQPQRFRGGVDLITVDVSAVDSQGRPVEDLKAGDFVVKVDGTPRSIVSAELIYTNFRRFGVDTSAVIPTRTPQPGQPPTQR
jgi:hypothetical protein